MTDWVCSKCGTRQDAEQKCSKCNFTFHQDAERVMGGKINWNVND